MPTKSAPREGEAKARYVSAMFAGIARRYDLMNTLMTAGRHHAWRRLAAKLADPKEGSVALDIACGTGDLTLALAQGGFGKVVGLDFCGEMVALAEAKARKTEVAGQVRYLLGDALKLPFPDESFHSVVTGFLLRNLANLEEALLEMHRVVKPGGLVVNLELTRPKGWLFPSLFNLYFSHIVPILGGVVSGSREAYTYLPGSVRRFLSAEELASLLLSLGFRQVRYQRLALGTVAIHVAQK